MNWIKKLLKRFKRPYFYEKCPCGGDFQQVDKYFTFEGHKILIDQCKNCGYTKER